MQYLHIIKQLFVFGFILTSGLLFSQEKLIVNYLFNYEFDITKTKDFKKLTLFKESNKNTGEYLLITSKNESIFSSIDKLNNNQSISEIESVQVPQHNIYIDFYNQYTLDQVSFKGKKFLVQDSTKSYNWIIERELDKVLGYEVKRAIAKRFNITYEAWFAPSLPFKSGPGSVYGLPGLILKLKIILDQEDGIHQHIYTATKVELNNKIKIEKPTKGELFMVDNFITHFNKLLSLEAEIENNRVEIKID